jgi:signal transduction histidine kinase
LIDPDTATGARLAQLLYPNGTVLRSTPPGLPPLLSGVAAARVTAGANLVSTTQVAGRAGDWRLFAVPVTVGGQPRVFVLLASLTAREETLQRLFVEFSVAGPIALLLAALAGYGLAAAALRPVESMRHRAAAITASTPGRRLPVPAARDEIARLAETLNRMLDRLQSAFEHERRFVADASHELRTPLALLRTELEVALRRPRTRVELEDALRSAVEETERLTRLTEDLLLIARSEQGHLPIQPEPVLATELLSRVAARFAGRARELGREVVVAGENGLVVNVDASQIEQALGNLLDNALVHGAGPIELSAYAHGALVELHVHDEGPGFPQQFEARAFDRFSRADDARSRGGSGLGLSIVEVIARAHGGAAHVASRVGAGADVWIAVPAAIQTASQL